MNTRVHSAWVELLREVTTIGMRDDVRQDADQPFCATELWARVYRGRVASIAGRDRRLYDELARDVWAALPECRGCDCGWCGFEDKRLAA